MTISAAIVGGLAAVAVPALFLRRFGPWPARVAAAAVVAVVAWVLSEPPRSDASERLTPVTVIATADLPGQGEQVEEGATPGARWRAAGGRVLEALVAARLDGQARDLAVVWTGPFALDQPPATGVRVPSATGDRVEAAACTVVPPPRVEPADVAVRLDAPLEIGRPATVSVALEGTDAAGRPRADSLPDGIAIHLAIEVANNGRAEALVARRASTAELRSGPLALRFRPTEPAAYRVRVELVDPELGLRAVGESELEATAPRSVVVVGEDAAGLVDALLVQGVQAVAWSELPKPLGEGSPAPTPSSERAEALPAPGGEPAAGTVVLLERPSVEQQEQLLRFLRAGGGVFVIGSEDGGALPLPGEPLHDIVPVLFEPSATRPDGPGEGEGDVEGAEGEPTKPTADDAPKPPDEGPEANDPDAANPTSTPAAPEPPVSPPDASPPLNEPEQAVSGNTDGAKLRPGPEVEVERRQVAMVLVVDRSASMGDPVGVYSKMDLAKRSALETAKALKRGDQLGVISFGRTGVPVVPLTDASNIDRIESELEKLRATDRQTLVRNALEQAQEMLEGSQAAVRHIVVISDGAIYDAGAIDHSAVLRAARIKKRNITLSAILIGELPAQTWVPQMTRLGGGKFYHSVDAAALPRFVSVEVASTLGRIGRQPVADSDPNVNPVPGGGGDGADQQPNDAEPGGPDRAPSDRPKTEEPEAKPPESNEPEAKDPDTNQPEAEQPEREKDDPTKPEREAKADRDDPTRRDPAEAVPLAVTALSDSALLAPDTNGEFPPVYGVLDVRGRPDARTLLIAGDAGLPLLAVQNRGLGKIAAWTSGLSAAWGRDWRSDLHFPARLAQWVTHLLPPRDVADLDVLTMAWQLTPPAPLRAERQWLQRWADLDRDLALMPLAERSFEPTQSVDIELRPAATPLAPWVLGAIVLLALVEWVVRRRFAI